MHAARRGHTDVVLVLLKADADVNAGEAFGNQTALMMAAREGHVDTVKALLKGGTDVNQKDDFGQTALYLATDEEVIQVLKRVGAKE